MARGKSQGIQSKNNREIGQRFGNAKGNAKGPGGVNQIGAHWGRHITDRRESSSYRGDPLDIGGGYDSGVPFGNTLTTNVGSGGPGKGYKLYGQSGSQCQYGKANPGSPMAGRGRDILSEFGPDYLNSKRRP